MLGLIPFILNITGNHDGASRRSDRRALLVSFDEGIFPAVNLDWDGCRLVGYRGGKKTGDVFKINAIRTISGKSTRPFIMARVVTKCWHRRELILAFDTVSESGREIIAGLVDQRVRETCAEKLKRNAGDRPIPGWMKLRPGGTT